MQAIMKALLLAGLPIGLLTGCAPRALSVTAEHPASPDAPAGRLVGPPAALRPGVADAPAPAPPPAPQSQQPHHGHQGHQGHH